MAKNSPSAPQLSLLESAKKAAVVLPPPAPPAKVEAAKEVMKEPVEKPAPRAPQARRSTAEDMAEKQREISISEFFTKNRHLLGFDNPSKALLTTIKEAVDNSLDACEEAGIIPEIEVEIQELGTDKFRVSVEDNGPGIVKAQIPKVFGKLLYGSKFHRLKQSRGQQGIGISAAVMYGQLTTGKPARVLSRTEAKKPAHEFLIRIDTRKNAPDAEDREVPWLRPVNPLLAAATHGTGEQIEKAHGTRVEIDMTANFVNGQRSILRYLEQTALANPHATIRYLRPRVAPLEFPRSTDQLPPEAVEIMPHPHGTELGMLMTKLAETEEKTLTTFLQKSFSRILPKAAEEICATAKVGPRAKPNDLTQPQMEALHKALLESKLPPPPTNCLAPIGDELMRKGLISFLSVLDVEDDLDQEAIARQAQLTLDKAKKKAPAAAPAAAPAVVAPVAPVPVAKTAPVRATSNAGLPLFASQATVAPPPAPVVDAASATPAPEGAPVEGAPPAPVVEEERLEEGEERIKGRRYFIATITRPPKVYRGNPFQVEVGIAYGGSWPSDKTIELYRMANRVPLLFQRGACGVTEAVIKTDWRNYELSQPKGALPVGPMAVLVHIASVWVPFTSESKEAIAHYPDIIAEIKLALMDCGRKLGTYLRKVKRAKQEGERRNKFLLYIEELATSLAHLTGQDREAIRLQLTDMAHAITSDADFEKQLDDAEKKGSSKKGDKGDKPAKKKKSDEDE